MRFLEFLVQHGPAVLFAAVFVDQIGVPLPAAPWLLAAGALAGAGKMNGLTALGAATIGAIVADMIWFYLGLYAGHHVLGLLCRISLEPDSCVRRTQDTFARYGMRGVVAAKFIPGVGLLAPPLAGGSGIRTSRFLFFDAIGSLLYTGTFMLLGVVFSRQLEQIIGALAALGRNALIVVGAAAALYIGYKYFRRHWLLRKLRMARITVDDLYKRLEAGDDPTILDLRSHRELAQSPLMIRGARHMTVGEIEIRHQEIPRDRDIILYCSCPNEATSAKVALLLHRRGILRVRPLLGGIDAWRERNFPMAP